MARIYKIDIKKIKEARIRKGLSQRKLAEELGYSNCYISKIENNKSSPSPERLIEICGYLGLEVKELISIL